MSISGKTGPRSTVEPENTIEVCRQRARGNAGEQCLAAFMLAAQAGDQSTYALLLGEVTQVLRRAVRRRYGFLQPSDIEDLVQEILLSLHAARATYDLDRPFLPWLWAIARNRMADAARRYARSSAHEVVSDPLVETFSEVEVNFYESAYGDPLALRAAICHLPLGQRQAVELFKLRELSLK